MNKRGQAAMEFLMTYGWAILVAVIVVGVLWYLIGNPANLKDGKFLDKYQANIKPLYDLCVENHLYFLEDKEPLCIKLNGSFVEKEYKIIKNLKGEYFLKELK